MSYQDPVTVSGSLVTFNDPDGDGRITNLSAAISPIQDLNGYDHPWPAGGGKNKFNIDAVEGTPDPTTGSNATSPRILEFGKFYKGLRSDNYYYPSYASYTISGGVLSVTAADNNAYGAAYTVEVDGGEDVTVSGVSPDGFVSVGWYDSDWNYLSGSIAYAIPHTFTMQTNAKCAVFVFRAPANSAATFSNIQIEKGSAATLWTPYENICPITGHDTVNVYVSPTTDAEDATVYASQLGRTVYGGMIDLVTGVLTVTHGYIASYNGETLPSTWISDRDEYAAGATPTIGAEVVYALASPLTYQISAQTIQTLLGTNNIWADAGDVTVTYQLARHGFEGWLIKVGTEQTEIPLNFIRYSTYKVTPDQRMEWSAERNVNGVLQRETVPNMPPKIEFNTKLLTNSDVTALMSILNKSFTVASERKLPVYFYDPENNTYKTCDCYMPDIDFKIRNVDTVKNIINYEELRFAFIGY